MTPTLDHLVIDVHANMDQAVRVFQSIGFTLTERGYHTLGSINHLAIFETDYVELLGIPNGGASRTDIEGFPSGLNGLVFKTDNADAVYDAMREAGYAPASPRSFSRPVKLVDGTKDAKFRTVHVPDSAVTFGRLYFCEHGTPELVWRPEWQQHKNTVTSIARVVVAARNPTDAAEPLVRIFPRDAFHTEPDGSLILRAGPADVAFVKPAALAPYGDAAPDEAGRADYMAAIHLRVRSVTEAAQALADGGVATARRDGSRIIVPARDASNTTLVLSE
jgi:hypothetical protein